MSEFKIGQYTISSKEYYNALLQNNCTDNATLKKLDTNNDKILSEDELTEVEIQDETNSETETTSASQTQEDSIQAVKEKYEKQISALQQQISALEEQRTTLLSGCGNSSDIEDIDSGIESAKELNTQIQSLKSQVAVLLYNMENEINQIEAAAASAASNVQNYSTNSTSTASSSSGVTQKTNFSYNFTEALTQGQASSLNSFKQHWAQNKARYQKVAAQTGVPAELIAAIHWRESGGNFNTRLHDGRALGNFSSWEESAIDALKGGYGQIDKNNIQTWYDFAERYNGLGYKNKGLPSPYVWAGTSNYTSGKYVADGVFDANCVDKQIGVAVMLKAIL